MYRINTLHCLYWAHKLKGKKIMKNWILKLNICLLGFCSSGLAADQINTQPNLGTLNQVSVPEQLGTRTQFNLNVYKIDSESAMAQKPKGDFSNLSSESQGAKKLNFQKSIEGGIHGGGGDATSMEFKSFGTEIVNRLMAQNIGAFDLNIAYIKSTYNIKTMELKNTIEKVRVETTTSPLFLDGVRKDAINYPAESRVVLDINRWNQLSEALKRQLAIHELLGIMGVDDKDYSASFALINQAIHPSYNCFKPDGYVAGRTTLHGIGEATCSSEERDAIQNGNCIDRDGSRVAKCIPKYNISQPNEKFVGECKAGPISPTDKNMCFPVDGLHVANGYDTALRCALQDAIAKCKIAGKNNCQFLVAENLGFVKDNTYPHSVHGVCIVRAYVTGL